MKQISRIFLTLGMIVPLLFLSTKNQAQNQFDNFKKDQDTLKENVGSLRDKVAGIEERITTAENDLAKLTKIKLSGYIQAQFLHYEAASAYPDNVFMVRRARLKIQYEPVNGVVFVLQPDFAPGSLSLKDAYVQLNDRWLKTFSLMAGKFNRPDYEVEYSSSSREVPERSKVIRAIYPDERAIGAKLEIAPQKLALKVQLAVFNGNDGISINNPVYNYGTGKWDNVNTVGQNTDFDNYKDFMGRATYAFKLGQWGGLTVGAHGYYGKIKANSLDALNSDYSYSKTLSSVGQGLKKSWAGVEAQFYADVLGGLAIKGEYIFGVNSTPGYNGSAKFTTSSSSMATDTTTNITTVTLTNLTTTTVNSAPAISRNFMGYYVYLIKNIGKHHQVAVRYDYYNPNTKLSASEIGTAKWDLAKGDDVKDNKTVTGTDPVVITNNQTKTTTTNKLVSGVNDIPYGTWTFAYTYYFDENIKIMLGYEMPVNAKVGVVDAKGVGNVFSEYTVNNVKSKYYYNEVIKQNTLTLRLQVKF